MTRALAIFTVSAGGMRLRVRLLASVRDVDREFRKGRPRRNGNVVHAYFESSVRARARTVGTIALPADGNLPELVPHEVAHAVTHHLANWSPEGGFTWQGDDERLATTIGLLCARVRAGLEARGVEA